MVIDFILKWWGVLWCLLLLSLALNGVLPITSGFSLGETVGYLTVFMVANAILVKLSDYKNEIIKAIKENK